MELTNCVISQGTERLIEKNQFFGELKTEGMERIYHLTLSLIFFYRKLLSFTSKSSVKHDRSEKDSCSSTKNSFPISDACASTRVTEKDLDISSTLFPALTGEKQVRRSVYFHNK